jgi:hypothetical protein
MCPWHCTAAGQWNVLLLLAVVLLCQVILAREYLKEVNISPDQVKYLVEEARRGGVQVRTDCNTVNDSKQQSQLQHQH